MQQIIKRIFSCIVVIIIFIISLFTVSDVLKPIFIEDVYNAIDAFYEQPENSFDVMVYGSSHAWKGFDTAEFSKNYSINAWNYGGNWQNINTTELFLEDSLISQSPKIVLIETFLVNEVHKNTVLNGEIMYTNHLRWSDTKIRYLKQVFGENNKEYFSYFFPFVYFHGNWSDLKRWNFVNPTDDYDFESNKGYLSSTNVTPIEIMDYKYFKQEKLSEDAEMILKRLVKTCHDRGIEVVFFVVPFEGQYNYGSAMKTFAQENNCYYVDFFEKATEANLNGQTDFQDSTHLNESGAKKVANYMGEYIMENFGIGSKQ